MATDKDRTEGGRLALVHVLDDGFVQLIDVTGNDSRIADAARLTSGSEGKDDRSLIRYLMRHRHDTPFEFSGFTVHIRIPMDAWRQFVRHRLFCLAGDTPLEFDLPGGQASSDRRLYRLTISEVYERFNAEGGTGVASPENRRDRVQRMRLRCLNEETGEAAHTNVVDVWRSGVKPTYRVNAGRSSVSMSADHLCLTDRGWLRLGSFCRLPTANDPRWSADAKIVRLGHRLTPPDSRPNEVDPETEEWKSVVGWEDRYQVSDQGRVRRVVGGRGSRSHGRCKTLTVNAGGYHVTSLNRPGEQAVKLVHRLMLEAFVGPPGEEQEARHLDRNRRNNTLENLAWGSSAENAADRVEHGTTVDLDAAPVTIDLITYDGEQETYDLEVSGPWHNFSADGLIVHNSINEYSTRYSPAIDSQQVTPPDQWRLQATNNRQGSGGFIARDLSAGPDGKMDGIGLSNEEENLHSHARRVYADRLAAGVAREQARKDLPLSTYTEAWVECDLRGWLHFLSLRMDSHAQKEIRDYATVIGEKIVAPLFPIAWEAFCDYRLGAVNLTRLDALMVSALSQVNWGERTYGFAVQCGRGEFAEHGWDRERCRERDECRDKLVRLGLLPEA